MTPARRAPRTAPATAPDASPSPPPSPPALVVPGTALVAVQTPHDMRVMDAARRWCTLFAVAHAMEELGLATVHEGSAALIVAVPVALKGSPAAFRAAVEDRTNIWRATDRVEALAQADRVRACIADALSSPSPPGPGDAPVGWLPLAELAQRMKCPADILGVGSS